jgi:hypothetical protein
MSRFLIILLCLGCAKSTAHTDASGDSPDDSQPDDPCTLWDKPRIEVGHGELAFESLDEAGDTDVELIYGPQGGWHSTIAIRAWGLDTATNYRLVLGGIIDEVTLGGGNPWAQFKCNRAVGALEYTGGLLIWESTPPELERKTATVEAWLLDPTREDPDHPSQSLEMAFGSATFKIYDPNFE